MTRPFRLTAPEIPEKQIQAAILDYPRLDYRVAWAYRFNTGARIVREFDANGCPKERRIQYAFKGCADILGQLVDGRFLAIECKSQKGRARPLQADFLEAVRMNKGVAILAVPLMTSAPRWRCISMRKGR